MEKFDIYAPFDLSMLSRSPPLFFSAGIEVEVKLNRLIDWIRLDEISSNVGHGSDLVWSGLFNAAAPAAAVVLLLLLLLLLLFEPNVEDTEGRKECKEGLVLAPV